MSDHKQITITDTEAERIGAFPDLSSILPIIFANNSAVGGISLRCGKCGHDMLPDTIKVDADVRKDSAALKLYAVCYDCHLITPATMRLSDDGTMMTCGPDGNIWHKGRYAAAGPVGVLAWCKFLLSKLVIK